MRTVQLSTRIRMAHFTDDQGSCGVLTLLPAYGHKVRVESYDDHEEFKFKYERLSKLEKEQQSRALLSRAYHAL
jgi:hypothetical protein